MSKSNSSLSTDGFFPSRRLLVEMQSSEEKFFIHFSTHEEKLKRLKESNSRDGYFPAEKEIVAGEIVYPFPLSKGEVQKT